MKSQLPWPVWMCLAFPAVLVTTAYWLDWCSYGQYVQWTGQLAALWLVAALAATPLRRLPWLLRHRRSFGVAMFVYAVLHTLAYLERKWGADLILREMRNLDMAIGWLALGLVLPLAVTSNDRSVRALGRRWKTLHWWIHPATVLVLGHWLLATAEPALGLVCALLVLALWFSRYRIRQQR